MKFLKCNKMATFKRTTIRHLTLTIILLITCICAHAQSSTNRRGLLRIAELNCENLLDTLHDEGFNDYEFLPNGEKQWTTSRYRHKLSMLSREIAGLGQQKPVDIVALLEVENDTVIRDLTQRTRLRQLDYKYIMTNSHDPRGIDIALLYQEGTFRPLETHCVDWRQRGVIDISTRDALHVKGIIRSGDTIDVIVCHMPSRIGGKKSANNRMNIAQNLRMYADSLIATRNACNLLIIGDFNDTPKSKSITHSIGAKPIKLGNNFSTADLHKNSLYNISQNHTSINGSQGSYRFRGHWEMLDQCIVSGNLLLQDSPLHIVNNQLHICDSKYLLEDEKAYGGFKPWRTYQGAWYKGGFSDHLPIMIELEY